MRTGSKRRTLGWGAGLLGLGVALCFVPLFDLLGFEWSFVIGIAAALAGAHLGAVAVWEARASASRADREGADARPARTVFHLWLGAQARATVLLLPPVGAITLNALRVRNCDYLNGIAWFLMLPVPAAAMGAAFGVALALSRRFARRITPTLLVLSVPLGSIAWSVWRIYAAPPIFAYDPFGGYFPGTIYDEAVAIGDALLWARLYHVALGVAVLGMCAWFLDGSRLALSWRAARGRARTFAFTLSACAAATGLWAAGPRLGFRLSAADVAQRLGAEHTTEHFVLSYSPNGPWAKDLQLHAADFEIRHAQLTALLGVQPEGRVHAFLFDSAAQKHTLMGASHTFVAKPWRREIYLQADGWPHPVLAHELAHVFAGRFGDPIFGVSRRGMRLNIGLIEGVAVAAAWQPSPLTPHQAVKIMRDAGIEPPLDAVLSLRFLGYNPSQAYNVAGSFTRFLLDRYGPVAVGKVFAAAGTEGSWEQAFGAPLAKLRSDWSHLIDDIGVPKENAAMLRDWLKRPSVFHKVCAHELALKREQARAEAGRGERDRALAKLDELCALDPDDPQSVADVMDAAFAAENAAASAQAAERLLRHAKVTTVLRGRAHALLGDLAFLRGDLDLAQRQYRLAEALPLDESAGRLVTVKRLAAAEPPGPVADGLKRFLLTPQKERDAATDLYQLTRLVALEPDRALFQYLLARQLEPRGRFADAQAALDKALSDDGGQLPDARFRREALRLLGRARFRTGDLAGAKAAFERLGLKADDATAAEAADWLSRIALTPGGS